MIEQCYCCGKQDELTTLYSGRNNEVNICRSCYLKIAKKNNEIAKNIIDMLLTTLTPIEFACFVEDTLNEFDDTMFDLSMDYLRDIATGKINE